MTFNETSSRNRFYLDVIGEKILLCFQSSLEKQGRGMYPTHRLYNVSFPTTGGICASAGRTSNTEEEEEKKREEDRAYFSIHIEVIRNYVFDVTMQHDAPETQEQWT